MYSPSANNIGMDLNVPTVRMVNRDSATLVVGDVVVMSTAHTGVVYPPTTRTHEPFSPLASVVKAGSAPFTPGFIGTVARLGPMDGRTNDTVDVVFGGLATAKVAAVGTNVVLGTQLSLSSTTGQLTNDATGRIVAISLGSVTAGQTGNIDVILDGEIAADTATLGTFATLAVTGNATVGGTLNTGGKVTSEISTATTNAIVPLMQVNAQSTGTPAAGFGPSIEFAAETSAGNTEIGATLAATVSSATAGSENFRFSMKSMHNGAAATDFFTYDPTSAANQMIFTQPVGQNRWFRFTNGSHIIGLICSDGNTGNTAIGSLSNHQLQLWANTTHVASVNPSGNVDIVNGNLVMSTSGKGIDFSAHSNAAGMTSELLNDYEEGTWTPTFTFSGGNTGVTYSSQLGWYTKVGRVVHAYARIQLTSKGSSSGNGRIDGFPFATSSTGYFMGPASVYYDKITAVNGIVTYMDNNATSIVLREVSDAGANTALTDGDFANDSQIHLQVTYII